MKTYLLTIPYIGKSTKQDLLELGITCVEDLKGKIQKNYIKKIVKKQHQENRCWLYVFRMCVYYAEQDC